MSVPRSSGKFNAFLTESGAHRAAKLAGAITFANRGSTRHGNVQAEDASRAIQVSLACLQICIRPDVAQLPRSPLFSVIEELNRGSRRTMGWACECGYDRNSTIGCPLIVSIDVLPRGRALNISLPGAPWLVCPHSWDFASLRACW